MIRLNESYAASADRGNLTTLTEKSFALQGWLTKVLRLEHRPQQEQMAITVAQAFASDTALLFEAGTGVGKSLAYLLPAVIHATDTGRQGIVSTHTISLQEQIQNKDLPLVRRLCSAVPELEKYQDFKTALLVGRANYLCATRLAQAIATKKELFPSAEQDELQRIREWAALTKTGLRHELHPPPNEEVWDWVNADSSACTPGSCDLQACFYQQARARLRQAQIIIVNHSLLFSLVSAGAAPAGKTPGVLFPHDFVVLDEAHTVPDVATEHAGHHLSSYGLNRLLYKLFHPKRRKGLFTKFGTPSDCRLVESALQQAGIFFETIRGNFLLQRETVRLREKDWCDPALCPPLKEIAERAATLADRLEDGPARQEMLDQKNRLEAWHYGLQDCLSLADDQQVYWVERAGRKGQITTLRTAPIDVAPFLRENIFSRKTAVILTSATLAEGPDMASFAEKVGAPGVENAQVASPFDYENHLRVHVATDAPPPSKENSRLDNSYLADMIAYCARRVAGGTLVLFTSYLDMRQTAAIVQEEWAKSKRPFYMQGEEGSRTELLRWFAEAGDGLLFGTDSCWMGVDVPGPALSQIIITRLPFENPSHPIAEARSDWIKAQGGSPFQQMILPDAVMKFRQGIGRLIRNKTDCGTVTVLDSRVLAKEYGPRFLSVLPKREYIRFNQANRDKMFQPL